MMKRLTAILCMTVLLCSLCCCAGASQSQAKRLGSSVIGMTMEVNQYCHVYRAPSETNSGILKTLEPGSAYSVMGYIRNSSTHNYWYLICWKDSGYGWYGWVSATMVDIDERFHGSVSGYGPGYCVITYPGTCKARSGPGQNYSQSAVVLQGNGFLVMEIRRGSNGKNWYNISVDGISCWISEGLADYYAY